MRDIVRMFLLLSAIIGISFGSECKCALKNCPEFVDLKNLVASLKQDIVQLQAKGKPEAFSAFMSDGFVLHHSKSLLNGETFVFDRTETNTNSAYDTNTGIFTVPSTGMYAFTWTLCVDSRVKDDKPWTRGEFGSQLIVNGRPSGSLHADTETGTDDDCSTGFVIKRTYKGSIVFLRNVYASQGALLSKTSQTRCTFSGWKLD